MYIPHRSTLYFELHFEVQCSCLENENRTKRSGREMTVTQSRFHVAVIRNVGMACRVHTESSELSPRCAPIVTTRVTGY